jgi:hypothetical protein
MKHAAVCSTAYRRRFFRIAFFRVSSGRRVSIMAFAPSFLAANVAHRTDNVTIELDKLR